jgi:hypothetical protein
VSSDYQAANGENKHQPKYRKKSVYSTQRWSGLDSRGNLFSGFEFNAERPFNIGNKVIMGNHMGQVIDTTWRCRHISASLAWTEVR